MRWRARRPAPEPDRPAALAAPDPGERLERSSGREVLVTATGDGLTLLHAATGTYFGLNRTGAAVWRALEEPATVADVATQVAAGFPVDAERALADTTALLSRLLEAGLVRPAGGR